MALPGDRLTEAYRRAQIRNAAGLAATVRRRFDGVDPTNLASTRNFLDVATQDVLRSNRNAATQASIYLRSISILEGDTRTPAAVDIAPPPPVEAIRTSLAVTGLAGLRDRLAMVQSKDDTERGARDRAEARSKSTAAVMGAAIRHGQNGARDTVVDFVEKGRARAFVRVTAMDEKVCYFCAVLASRLNYSRDSFEISDGQFTGPGTAKVHDSCRCHLRPVFTVGVPDETQFYRDMWAELSGEAIDGSNRGALKNFRSQWEKRLRDGIAPDIAVA